MGNLSNEDVIVAFLRKEPLTRGKLYSNSRKLVYNNIVLGQWMAHKVIMNDSTYEESAIARLQTAFFKWLRKSDIIFKTVDNIPNTAKEIVSYYEGK